VDEMDCRREESNFPDNDACDDDDDEEDDEEEVDDDVELGSESLSESENESSNSPSPVNEDNLVVDITLVMGVVLLPNIDPELLLLLLLLLLGLTNLDD